MRRALGRGLSQLLGEAAEETTLTTLPLTSIVPNQRQPRRHFDEEALKDLAASIKEVGVIQPLLVRPLAEGEYELVAGERRLRASLMAGLDEVPVVIRTIEEQASLELAIIENLQREDISAVESAKAFQGLITEFGLTQDEVAKKVGKSRSAITNTLRLLQLPEEVQQSVLEGQISEGHARALLTAVDKERQLALLKKIRERQLSVREVERLAKADASARLPGHEEKPSRRRSPHDEALCDALSEKLGFRVTLKRNGEGGTIEIPFYSEEDLTRITDQFGIEL